VLDFGISKNTFAGTGDLALTKTTAVMGSPLYMSPEQMRATRNVDARTDVWSLGVTLYQLVAGRVPFYSESPMELGGKVLHESPEPLERAQPGVSAALSAVVDRCLEKDPARRFASVRELSAALEQALVASAPPPAQTTGTRVLVSVNAGAGGNEDPISLPFSQTSIAHSHTAGGSRVAPRRSLAFVALALGGAAALFFVLRARTDGAPSIAAGADVQVVAPPAVDASLAVVASATSALLAPPAPTLEAKPLASVSVPASPASSAAPHPRGGSTRSGNKRSDSGAGAAPPAPQPQPSSAPTSNPRDHL